MDIKQFNYFLREYSIKKWQCLLFILNVLENIELILILVQDNRIKRFQANFPGYPFNPKPMNPAISFS